MARRTALTAPILLTDSSDEEMFEIIPRVSPSTSSGVSSLDSTIIDLTSDSEMSMVSDFSSSAEDSDESSEDASSIPPRGSCALQKLNESSICCDFCDDKLSTAAVMPCKKRMCEDCLNKVSGRFCEECHADRTFWVLVSDIDYIISECFLISSSSSLGTSPTFSSEC